MNVVLNYGLSRFSRKNTRESVKRLLVSLLMLLTGLWLATAEAAVTYQSVSSAIGIGSGISFVNAGTAASATSGNVTPALPAGIAQNDLLVCLVASRVNVVPSISGWNQRYSVSFNADLQSSLFWKIAGASESNPTVSYSGAAGVIARCFAFRGIDTTSPFDVADAASHRGTVTGDDKMTTGSLTTVTNGAVILIAGYANGNVDQGNGVTTGGGLSWSTAYFSRYNPSGSANDVAIGFAYASQTTAGAIGPLSLDTSGNANNQGAILALKPAPRQISIAMPTGTSLNDVLIATLAVRKHDATVTAPVGWTLLLDSQQSNGAATCAVGTTAGMRLLTYYKVAAAGEPTATWGYSSTCYDDGFAVGGILRFSGVDTSSPIVTSAALLSPGSSATVTAPAVTPGIANTMLVTAHSYASSGTWTVPPTNMAERVDWNSYDAVMGTGTMLEMNTESIAGAVSTGTRVATGDAAGDYGAGHSLILRPATTTLATGTDPAAAIIAPGAAATDVDWFTLQTSGGTETITSVTVNLSTSSGVGRLAITDNAGTELGFTTSPVTGSNTITVAGMSATTALTTFKVRVTPLSHAAMPLPPGAAYAITAPVTAWAGPSTHAGSDTNTNALTIDNLSPAGATAVSGSSGNLSNTLNWTTSASADFSRSVVLRWTGGTAGTEVPAEGTDYVNTNTITTATVVCVRTADAASTAVSGVDGAGTGGCSATALASGQAYTYKVFQKDSNGNYDVGVAMGTFTTLLITTLATGTDPAAATIAPGAAAADVDLFSLQTNSGTEAITSVTVNLSTNSGVGRLAITNNAGTELGFTTSPVTGSNTIAVAGMSATTTLTTFKVRVTPLAHSAMPVPPGANYAITAPVTAWAGPNTHAGSDTNPNALTIDNLSPTGATVVSGSPGDLQVTLNWTTSASADFSRSVVLRWTGVSAGTEVPAEGTDYVNTNTITTATVVCVRTADAASTAVSGVDGAGTGGCSATALTSGQAYTYKIFQKDSNGNYDVGVATGTFTTLPRVISINRLDADPTSAATVRWTVTFSVSVTGVDASAFALVATGLSGAYIATVTGSGTSWTVTANTGIGSGTLRLDQTGPGSVVPTLSGTFTTGQFYTITATPALAEYRMDQALWNGTANEVVDSSGSGLHAVAVNGASTTGGSNSEAIPGNPGTCRYGAFNGGYVQTPLPNLTTDFTITAWIRTTDNTKVGQRILIDDEGTAPANGYGFSFHDAGAAVLRFFSRGITSNVILDSTYPIANNTWYFVAAVADITNKMRTIYVFNQSGSLLNTTTEAAWTSGTWGTDGGPVSIGGETIASGESGLHFVGNLDEVRVYQKVLSQTALAAIATQTHPCAFTGPDHYELSLPTSSITCLPTTATVTACANASSPCTNPLAASSGTTATLATNGGTLGITPVTFGATGTVSTTLSYPAAGDGTGVTVTLSGEQIAVVSPRQCCPDGTSCVVASSCSTTFRTAGFIFSSSVGGGVATIPTQVAGTSSGTYYLRAVKTLDNSSHTCGAAFSGANTVNFAYECNNPTSCSSSNLMSVNGGSATTIARNNIGGHASTTSVNMTFDATGNAPLTFVYSDVGLVKLWVNKTTVNSAVLTGSSNAFVVKPGGFVLSGIPAAADATGAKFVKAGEAFSATVTATTTPASGALTTPNYGKENAPAEGVKLTNALVTGLGLTDNPTLGGSFGSFTNGVATGAAFTWNEVGTITLTPSVGDGDYLGTGDTIGTQSNVGRFYAAKIALSGGSIANRTDIAGCAAPCGLFTYMGEPMSALFTLTAKAVDGTTTLLNYNWSATAANQFAKLDPMAVVTSGTGGPLGMGAVDSAATRTPFPPCSGTPAHPCLTPAQATAGTFASGVATVTVPFTIYRDNGAAKGPYALLDVGVNPADSDGAALATLDLAVNGGGSPNTHGKVKSTQTRYGRLKMQNIYGSEKSTLQIPVQAQYWSGNSWVLNSDDSATLIPASSVAFSNYRTTGWSTTASGPNTLAGGTGIIALSAPLPLLVSGRHPTGSVDICVDLGTDPVGGVLCSATSANLPYLKGKWPPGANYDNDPSATATFGVYSPETKKTVHVRELY